MSSQDNIQYIDVAMIAWPNHPDRVQYFRQTMEAIQKHLTASRHTLRFYCSAESERDPKHQWCGHELEQLCNDYDITLVWRDAPANLGANSNHVLAMCSAPTILYQQADWLLRYPLDLSPGSDFMVENPDVDLLRYSWPEDPKMLPTIEDRGGGWANGGWRQIDINGMWPYGDDPHLRRRDFFWKHGWYFEGGRHGTASGTMMRWLVKHRAVIAAADKCYYSHFGAVSAVLNDHRKRGVVR